MKYLAILSCYEDRTDQYGDPDPQTEYDFQIAGNFDALKAIIQTHYRRYFVHEPDHSIYALADDEFLSTEQFEEIQKLADKAVISERKQRDMRERERLAEEKRKQEARQEQYERKQYERLKAKFEPAKEL